MKRVLAGGDGVAVELKGKIQRAEHQGHEQQGKAHKGKAKLPGGARPAAENGQMFHQKITPLAWGKAAEIRGFCGRFYPNLGFSG